MAKTSLKIGYLPIIDHLILGISKFKAEKYPVLFPHSDIEMVQKSAWNEVGNALMAGAIDMAFMLAPYAMDLYSAKKNIKLLLLSHRDGSVLVTNKKANITKLEDFKGKIVLIPYQASLHHVILHKVLSSAGLTLGLGKDVTTEPVAPGMIPAAIQFDEEGAIAGFIVADPFGTVVVSAGHGDVLKLSKEVVPDHPCCAIVARDEVIQNHPEAVQELIKSFVQSGSVVRQDIEKTIPVAMNFLNQPEPVVRAIMEDKNERFSTERLMPKLDELEEIQNYLIDTVTIPALSGKIEMDKFVDLRFAQAAGAK
jgi:NitT/TauT family transport system substrate-binding protein